MTFNQGFRSRNGSMSLKLASETEPHISGGCQHTWSASTRVDWKGSIRMKLWISKISTENRTGFLVNESSAWETRGWYPTVLVAWNVQWICMWIQHSCLKNWNPNISRWSYHVSSLSSNGQLGTSPILRQIMTNWQTVTKICICIYILYKHIDVGKLSDVQAEDVWSNFSSWGLNAPAMLC